MGKTTYIIKSKLNVDIFPPHSSFLPFRFSSEIMADRKAELEAKREKLRQIREDKERRRREKEQQDAEKAARSLRGETPSSIQSTSSDSPQGSVNTNQQDIDR